MRARAVVVTEPFLRRLEVAADDVLERIDPRKMSTELERYDLVEPPDFAVLIPVKHRNMSMLRARVSPMFLVGCKRRDMESGRRLVVVHRVHLSYTWEQ